MDERMQTVVIEERTERRSVSMPVEDWQRLDEYGKQMGLGTSPVIRMLLRTHPDLNRNGK